MVCSWNLDPIGLVEFSCNDYKNPDKGIFIDEIEKDVFFSEYYQARLGERILFNSNQPIFSSENKGIQIKLTPEYIEKIEQISDYDKIFHFGVGAVYMHNTTKEYKVLFGSAKDGIEISYVDYDDKEEVSIYFG